MFQEVD